MSQVSFDERSVLVKGRRVWIHAAAVEYALLPRESWDDRLSTLAAAGFTAVSTAVPWRLHEPRHGAQSFEGVRDLRAFVLAAAAHGLWVVLRVGPNVGEPWSSGGLPDWLSEPGWQRPREAPIADPRFVEAVGAWWKALFEQVRDLQAGGDGAPEPSNGALLLVQLEEQWDCASDEAGLRYLSMLAHLAREHGVTVPLLTNNGLWAPTEAATETWTGSDGLLSHVRQLRLVQPGAPAFVSVETVLDDADSPARASRRVAAVLAAGGQPTLRHAVAGVVVQPRPGRAPTDDPRAARTHLAERGAILDAFGRPTESFALMRRLAGFSRAFGPAHAEAEASLDAVVADHESGEVTSIVTRASASGSRLVFILPADRAPAAVPLLLADGRAVDVPLGGEPIGWIASDVDLSGRGTLDWTTAAPFELVDGRILACCVPAGMSASISINDSVLEVVAPTKRASSPLVVEHMGFILVICTPEQSGAVRRDGDSLVFGVDGRHADGSWRGVRGLEAIRIDGDGAVEALEDASPPRRRKVRTLDGWTTAALASEIDGSSDRFASLDGPASFEACGARSGWGIYRATWRSAKSSKRELELPTGEHRVAAYLDGERIAFAGIGAGTESNSFELATGAGEHTLVFFVQQLGGPTAGAAQVAPVGLHAAPATWKKLAGVKVATATAAPIDPFHPTEVKENVVAFVPGATAGEGSSDVAITWSFSHRRATALRIALPEVVAGTWLLNDAFLGRTDIGMHPVLALGDAANGLLKRGNNVLVFRADDVDAFVDDGGKAFAKNARIDECIDSLAGATWAFSRWHVPDGLVHRFTPGDAGSDGPSGVPTWSQVSLDALGSAEDVMLDCSGMTIGDVFVDGRAIGRYEARDLDGNPLGGEIRVPLPPAIAFTGGLLQVFDLGGADPRSIRLT